jgi:hypothetical protein
MNDEATCEPHIRESAAIIKAAQVLTDARGPAQASSSAGAPKPPGTGGVRRPVD